ncbi:MAG: urocanate hydratase [Terriglobia bacterium]
MGNIRVRGMSPVQSPIGTELSCKGWEQEAALRMLMNSVAVAEEPEELLASGGVGKVARDWEAFHEIIATLKRLENDESLLVESGRPAGIHRTGRTAPRVLMVGARSASEERLVPTFEPAPAPTLMNDKHHPLAGSWAYVGPAGAFHTSYEVLAAIKERCHGDLTGKLVVSAGMGGMGGALPLAAAAHGAAFLGIEVAMATITRRIREGYCDYCVNDLDEALRILKIAIRRRQPVSVGLVANASETVPELARRGVLPDVLTDQTCAGYPVNAYVPAGLSPEAAAELRNRSPHDYLARSTASIARHVQGMLDLQKLGALTFEFGNGIRATASELGGVKEAFSFPSFVEAFLEPLIRRGRSPVLWVALSGNPADGCKIDETLPELFPEDKGLSHSAHFARKYMRFQGLPARGSWLSREERLLFAARINRLVGTQKITAPVVFVTDECEGLERGIPFTPSPTHFEASVMAGASWVALPRENLGRRLLHPVCALLADGTPHAAERLRRAFAASPSK